MQPPLAIVGLGYVGLPLSLQFCRKGNRVVGLDIDQAKVDKLNRGESYIHHISTESVAKEVDAGRFLASSDFSKVSDCRAVVICVPTPLNKNREPDISYILSTGRAIAPHLRQGMLVVLESTTYPGTTDEDLRCVLEAGSGLAAGQDFYLAFSPEREDPGNPNSMVEKIPKVVGGYTPECLKQATNLYSSALNTVVPVSSCRAAEATKLLENQLAYLILLMTCYQHTRLIRYDLMRLSFPDFVFYNPFLILGNGVIVVCFFDPSSF